MTDPVTTPLALAPPPAAPRTPPPAHTSPTHPPPQPRALRRAGFRLLAGCVTAGVAQALLWSAFAPAEQFRVLPDGQYGALPTQWTYPFTSIAVLALLGVVAGAVIGAAAWRLRSLRGSGMLLVVAASCAAGSLVAWIGARLLRAAGVDPATVGATGVDLVVTAPAMTGSLLVTVAQPAVAVAVYTVLAAWNGRPDLGRSR